MLDGEPLTEYSNKGIEEIARNMGVQRPDVSVSYELLKNVARSFLETLDNDQLSPSEFHEKYQAQLAKLIKPYSDNPAYQAFLERKYTARTGFEL